MTALLIAALRTHRPLWRRAGLRCSCGRRWHWRRRFGCAVYLDLLNELARTGSNADSR